MSRGDRDTNNFGEARVASVLGLRLGKSRGDDELLTSTDECHTLKLNYTLTSDFLLY